jgi:hypothetical protein
MAVVTWKKPAIPASEFNGPEEAIDPTWNVKWRKSTNFTYVPVEVPFQKIIIPSLDDLKKFR